jgi:hypothetical protein
MPFAAIEAVLSRSRFESTVAEAQTPAQPEEFDFLALLDERYSSVRKFAPWLLEHFECHAAPTATELLQALDILRELNVSGKRALPEKVPTGLVKPRWQPYVFAAGGIDRHFYEICALAELRDRLRAGDIWVTGSRQYRDFEVIAATANEAPHVLDGLLYHQSSLVINEHYTDTGCFSDHVFAICRLLGFLFAPRIRDLKGKRLYICCDSPPRSKRVP